MSLPASLLRGLVALAALLFAAVASAAGPLPPPAPGQLTVYFLDVGQGDAALIVSPTGKSVLVDAGPPEAGRDLSRRLAALLDGPVDLAIISHPHLDHLGGLPAVLDRPGARRYMDPGFEHATSAYRELLRKVAALEVPLLEPELAEDGGPFTLELGGGAKLTVLWPRRPKEAFLSGTRSDANANSIVLRLDHGEVSFLFTGDAEADTESRLLRSGQRLSATVLKAPHHGSRHSSQAPFLERVKPEVVVVSCGRNNEYRHPHEHALRRFRAVGAHVLRTDVDGDLVAVSDGQSVSFGEEAVARAPSASEARAAEPGDADGRSERVEVDTVPAVATTAAGRYGASRRSEVFHRADCSTLQRIKPANLVWFEDREDAAARLRPSADCQP